jgi:hypothetical protein
VVLLMLFVTPRAAAGPAQGRPNRATIVVRVLEVLWDDAAGSDG